MRCTICTLRAEAARGIDADYWKKCLRALEQTCDLVTTQRQRVAKLFDMLERGKLDGQGGSAVRAAVA